MNPQSINEMFDYIYWSFDLIWSYIDRLSDRQFCADLGYSYGSIRNQIIHLISSHRRWLYRMQRIDPPQHLEFEDFPTKEDVRAEWDTAKSEMLEFVNSLSQDNLDEEIEYGIQGRISRASNHRWQILLHLFNHSTDHRSQILAIINSQLGIDTPEQDYIFYLWESQKSLK